MTSIYNYYFHKYIPQFFESFIYYSILREFGYEKFEKVVNMIGGKWKLRIIYVLAFHEILRYGELKRFLSPITHKMLTAQLKELEKDGLVLTLMGKNLKPVVKKIHTWIMKYDI